ncbi:V-type H+-transporting ATPase subunit D [Pancytospora epiphaga]|nr:V-type H+-transporting ATPase subunit D [Pancytospora epiphaga]
MTAERIQIFATRSNYKIVEARLRNARHGHGLLKVKSDALQIQYREIEERYERNMHDINKYFKKAFLLLSRAEFYGANLEIFRKRCARSPVTLDTELDQVCGVVLSVFKLVRQPIEDQDMLSSGGAELVKCKREFDNLLKMLVDMASVKNSYFILKQTLEHTNRRVNALEHMLIPKLEKTLKFISSELDEQERENFYRLKKIQNLNK